MADQSAWSLREHVIGDAESVYGINQLPHKNPEHVIGHAESAYGTSQASHKSWRGHLVPPSSNASSGTPRVLMSPMSPIDPKALKVAAWASKGQKSCGRFKFGKESCGRINVHFDRHIRLTPNSRQTSNPETDSSLHPRFELLATYSCSILTPTPGWNNPKLKTYRSYRSVFTTYLTGLSISLAPKFVPLAAIKLQGKFPLTCSSFNLLTIRSFSIAFKIQHIQITLLQDKTVPHTLAITSARAPYPTRPYPPPAPAATRVARRPSHDEGTGA
ncbi:hypothetical protein C8R44DRAFT_747269 [Mycena epipterygia]|nr:hypothetical protein C8R44DRAFT_747269 [Mycena epipterygia]